MWRVAAVHFIGELVLRKIWAEGASKKAAINDQITADPAINTWSGPMVHRWESCH